jgi:hypothetical protein
MELELAGYDYDGEVQWRLPGWAARRQTGLWYWAEFPDWRGPLPSELEDFVAWDAWQRAWLMEIDLGRRDA